MSESRRREFERDIDDVRGIHAGLTKGAGGTSGGTWLFFIGLVLAGAGLWFFLSNVHAVPRDVGFFSNAFNRGLFGVVPANATVRSSPG